MKKSGKHFLPDLSHIYVESAARGYSLTDDCLKRFPKATVLDVPDYKLVFNKTGQDFQTQKHSMKLILAVKKPPLIYKGTDMIQNGGYKNFFYNTPMMNCLYNCDYCFLQGMYSSANLVIFVNQDDMQLAVSEEMKQRPYPEDPLMLSLSYNTDLLAFENILPITRNWIEYAKQHPDLYLEVRTKSTLFSAISDIEPIENVVLAWTLSPDKIVTNNELNTPSLAKRIAAIQSAMDQGWKVRLCFDPILIYQNWESDYRKLIHQVRLELDGNNIIDITVGVFRMGQDYFQNIRRSQPESKLYYDHYEIKEKVVTIPYPDRQAVEKLMKENLVGYIPSENIHFWC